MVAPCCSIPDNSIQLDAFIGVCHDRTQDWSTPSARKEAGSFCEVHEPRRRRTVRARTGYGRRERLPEHASAASAEVSSHLLPVVRTGCAASDGMRPSSRHVVEGRTQARRHGDAAFVRKCGVHQSGALGVCDAEAKFSRSCRAWNVQAHRRAGAEHPETAYFVIWQSSRRPCGQFTRACRQTWRNDNDNR